MPRGASNCGFWDLGVGLACGCSWAVYAQRRFFRRGNSDALHGHLIQFQLQAEVRMEVKMMDTERSIAEKSLRRGSDLYVLFIRDCFH